MLQPKYLARKVAWLLVTFFIVATFNFLLFHVMPGNPVLLLARSGHLTQQEAAQVTKLYGLNHSLFDQYFIYLDNLLHGQLGISYAYHVAGQPAAWASTSATRSCCCSRRR